MGRDKEKQVGAVAVDAAIPCGSKGRRSPMSQLDLPIPPWRGARYGSPYMSGEVAIMPHQSTESTGMRPPPAQPAADLDATPAAPQAVAVAAAEAPWGDDMPTKVAPRPDAVTNTTAPAPAPDKPLAAFAQRLGRGMDKNNAAGCSQAE